MPPIISLRHLAHNISVLKQTLVNHCIEKNVPVFPGCVNASDMTRAVNAGLKVIKFFPAEQSGGVAFLKALALVLPLNIMLTGGVNTKNLKDLIEGAMKTSRAFSIVFGMARKVENSSIFAGTVIECMKAPLSE